MSHKVNVARVGMSGLYCVGVVVPTGERPDDAEVNAEVAKRGLRYLTDRWDEQELSDDPTRSLFTKPAEPN